MSIQTIDGTKGKTYKATVRVHGKRVCKNFKRKVDAEKWERTLMLARHDIRKNLDSTIPTLNEFRQTFIDGYSNLRQSPSTRIVSNITYKKYIDPELGHLKLDDITKKDVSTLLQNAAKSQKVSLGHINKIRTILNVMFTYAIDQELIDHNPVKDTKPFKQKDYSKETVVNYITQDETQRLINWMAKNDLWLYPKIAILLNTGARLGEMTSLRVRDFQVEGNMLFIQRTYCRHTKQMRNKPKSLSRVFPLDNSVSKVLLAQNKNKKPDDMLLWDKTESYAFPTKLRKHFWKALDGARCRRIRIHDLRHTFAVHFLENGGQIYDLQKLLGHSTVRMTERYSHFSNVMTERSRGIVSHIPTKTDDTKKTPNRFSTKK